jgi:hypothetical protein
MRRLRKTPRNQALAETSQEPLDAAAVESSDEGHGGANTNRDSLPAGYVKWETNFNYFSGVQAAISALIEAWQRRRSRRS